jgi:hypothetical protein
MYGSVPCFLFHMLKPAKNFKVSYPIFLLLYPNNLKKKKREGTAKTLSFHK